MIYLSPIAQSSTSREFLFRVNSPGISSVSVAGVFNSWNKDANPMTLQPDGRTWTTKLNLPFGKIQYKFVLNGQQWVLDPTAPAVPDGNGHTNSEIANYPPGYERPASPTDGLITLSALAHVQKEPQLNYDHGKLQIEFTARPHDLAEVDLIVNDQVHPMNEIAEDDIFEIYRYELPWDRKQNLSYSFQLHDGSRVAYFGPSGLTNLRSKPYTLSAKDYKPFTIPGWVEGSVCYQIFPDRFANGDPSNDPKDVEPPTAKPTYSNRFGGDVKGVADHLGYLKSLGVNLVYFTPVFESPSNHRYDATDYRKIDPQFGTNREFDSLVQSMKREGIRTVMDFAFNHSATNFYAFQDVLEKQKSSKYLPWYFIKSFPVTVKEDPPYLAFYQFPSMPKLNVVNPPTEKYLLETVDYWRTNAGIEGARLDAADEVDQRLWKDLRSREKADDPNFWIVGEEWGDATPWLAGDQWDSTMGYQFRDVMLKFLADQTMTASECLDHLNLIYSSYPPQVSRNLMNLIGTHDTPRFLTLCHGDRNLLKVGATLLLTWPGTPNIYYGDELGMEGGPDPDNRRMMDWSAATERNPILKYYKLLIHARNTSEALKHGDPLLLASDNAKRSFAFARIYNSSSAIIAVNASKQPQTLSIKIPKPLQKGMTDILSGRNYPSSDVLALDLPAESSIVLLSK